MSFMNLYIKNYIFVLIFLVSIWTTAHAQSQDYNWQIFNEKLSLSRGSFYSAEQFSEWLPRNDYCRLVEAEWGWSGCEGIAALITFPTRSINTLVINEPISSGYVKFDDWKSSNKDESIKQIEDELRKSTDEQSKVTSQNIQFLGWHTYPKLNEEKKFLYYTTKTIWDGDTQLNVKASIFDRKGYVEFLLIPDEHDVSTLDIELMIDEVLSLYKSSPNENYDSYMPGDKVSEIGVLGILATLAGVKWGKFAVTGLIAILLAFAKKGWVLLLLPLLFLGRLFSKKKN